MNNNEYYLAEIAKLYYTDKMKQNEIAKRFRITPMMVSRKLKEAEEKGLVTFSVKMPWDMNMSLSEKVTQMYGLDESVVLSVKPQTDIPMLLGRYLAEYVMNILQDNMVMGLSWGKTIARFVEFLSFVNVKNCDIFQLSGTFLGENYYLTPTGIIQEATKKINAKISIINEPMYVSSPQIKKELQKNPLRTAIDKLAEHSDINVFGVSKISREATTINENYITEADYKELLEVGAIGDVAGIFIDKDGNCVDWSKKDCYTGVSLDKISQGKIVVCVAGEVQKKEVIKVAAKKKYFNTLITTEEVAEYLVQNS